MSKVFKRPSLLQLFEAPDDFRGIFGWLCGYSGDGAFFRDAVERFSHASHSSRAASGNVCLAVMLDPHNPQISAVDVPGLAHLLFKENPERPFRLLHAKVAILGFRSNANSEDWMIRLIVCTGNWTRQTLEENLDLAWHVEIEPSQLKSAENDTSQICVDIQAAWNMMKWLRGLFDTRLLEGGGHTGDWKETQTTDSYNWFKQTIKQVEDAAPGRNITPRYCDNRKQSLLAQLPDMIEKQAGKTKRNYIAMGSGFFEASVGKNTVPGVLDRVINELKENALLTQSSEVDVFVNPKGCQAVAGSLDAIKDRAWSVRPASPPNKYFGSEVRTLHAKFIFSANYREASNNCNSAWIYLGSGNLTNPGFCKPQSKLYGNLEAGTVLAPTELYWREAEAPAEKKVVSNLLPLQWEEKLEKNSDIAAGEGFEPTDEIHIAPPVAYLVWAKNENIGELLVTVPKEKPDMDVLDPDGHPCTRNTNGSYHWCGERPRQVAVVWSGLDNEKQHKALVPVIDELGRIAATCLPPIEMQDVWWRLEDFPASFEEDSIDSDDGSLEEVPNAATPVTASGVTESSYPIRTMMELVEKIANRQTSISQIDWNSWCIRLEHTLTQAAESDVLKMFRKISVNPISPLREKPFRPDFAETGKNHEGERYEGLLNRVEQTWKVHNLAKLEVKG